VTGRANLQKHLMADAGRTAPGLADGQLNTHLILQPIITLGPDGRTAKGTWHEVALLGSFGASASWRGGIYENEYVLENGVWKISRVQFFEQYRGAYDDYGTRRRPVGHPVSLRLAARRRDDSEERARRARAAVEAAPAARLASLASACSGCRTKPPCRTCSTATATTWIASCGTTSRICLPTTARGKSAGRASTWAAHIRKALEGYYGAPALRHGELFDHIMLAPVVTVAPDGRTASAAPRS
jgi:hypothetical protein